ncbi:hypothetical protein [Chromobacterium violaceum]|uniref:hypothetical protein n=1 Tax=Chromobacterium violaceum TaxID=536 RepID=UPI000A96D1B9|nr:hypothetical protein [Chromobacterium violaceum]
MMNGVSGAMSPSLSGVAAAAPSASAAGGSALGGSLRGVGTVAADAPRSAAGTGSACADLQARLAELKGGLDAAAGMAKQLSDDVSLSAERRSDAAELAGLMERLGGRLSAGGALSLARNLGGAREG